MDHERNTFSDKLKEQVTESFDRLRKALDLREKLLLRQLSVVVQQSHHVTFQFDNIRFVNNGEEDLVGKMRTYGKFNIDNFNIILKDHYENEDYIQPVNDHDLMHKSCRRTATDEAKGNPESEEIAVEFFNNKSLIKEGAEMVRESIINLALNESKELIDKSFGTTGGVELEEELERMKIDLTNFRNRERIVTDSLSIQGECDKTTVDISNNNNNNNNNDTQSESMGIDQTKIAKQQQMVTKASQTELDKIDRHTNNAALNDIDRNLIVRTNKCVDKNLKNISSLTMNNCGGTINLKNVTSLTINTCPEKNEAKFHSEAQSAPRCASEEGSPECGFYKRLISENKILRQHLKASLANTKTCVLNSQSSEAGTETTSDTERSDDPATTNSLDTSGCKSHRIPLTAAELRAVLNLPQQDETLTHVLGDLFTLAAPKPATKDAKQSASQEHTMQIQQWLKQIISETETEPFQSAELMESSQINN